MRNGENALAVIRGVKEKIARIAPSLPPGVSIKPFYDRSTLIERTIATLKKALLEEILSLSQPLAYVKNPRRHSDQDVFIADIGKARTLLGVTPQVSAREGIVSMLEWVRSCIRYKPFAC